MNILVIWSFWGKKKKIQKMGFGGLYISWVNTFSTKTKNKNPKLFRVISRFLQIFFLCNFYPLSIFSFLVVYEHDNRCMLQGSYWNEKTSSLFFIVISFRGQMLWGVGVLLFSTLPLSLLSCWVTIMSLLIIIIPSMAVTKTPWTDVITITLWLSPNVLGFLLTPLFLLLIFVLLQRVWSGYSG